MAHRLPDNRAPTHPGEVLRKDFLEPLDLTVSDLADHLGVSRQRVSAVVNERREVTVETALLLAEAFEMSAQFWLNLQQKRSLWENLRREETAEKLDRVTPISA